MQLLAGARLDVENTRGRTPCEEAHFAQHDALANTLECYVLFPQHFPALRLQAGPGGGNGWLMVNGGGDELRWDSEEEAPIHFDADYQALKPQARPALSLFRPACRTCRRRRTVNWCWWRQCSVDSCCWPRLIVLAGVDLTVGERLLRHFRWQRDRLVDAYLADPNRVRAQAKATLHHHHSWLWTGGAGCGRGKGRESQWEAKPSSRSLPPYEVNVVIGSECCICCDPITNDLAAIVNCGSAE